MVTGERTARKAVSPDFKTHCHYLLSVTACFIICHILIHPVQCLHVEIRGQFAEVSSAPVGSRVKLRQQVPVPSDPSCLSSFMISMSKCVCVSECVYMYMCIYVYAHVWMHACMHACVCVHIHACAHMCACA